MTPTRRLIAYMKARPIGYAVGTLLTIGYAVSFQWIPLAVREVVEVLEQQSGVGRDAALAAIRWPVLMLAAASAVHALFRLTSRIVMFRVGREIEFSLRNDYFSHLQSLPASFFASHRTGDLMSRAVNDINNVRLLLGMGLLNIIQTPVLYVGALAVMLTIDPWLTLWALLPFPLFVLFARYFARRIFVATLAGQDQLGRLSTRVQENASGVMVVRSYVLEDRERTRFAEENVELQRRMVRVGTISATLFSAVGVLPALSAGLVLVVGGQAVQAGRMGVEDLWVYWVYIGMLTFPTVLLGWVLSIVQRGFAGLSRLGEILDVEPSIRDRDDVASLTAIEGGIEFAGLSFGYQRVRLGDGQETETGGVQEPKPQVDSPVALVLEDVDLEVPAGSTLGIVGPVGSGKSTLLNIVPRLFEIPDGQVLIDGVDLNRIPLEVLRRSIAMVPQDSFLFSATLADNIRFGRPDADLDEVRAAAERAGVLEDIESFPDGFDTVVGERGITLSGGQRQRVALARALLLRPSILILDDSLSSVDHETEERILRGLRDAKAGRTSLIAAHRISAVRDADNIVVLEKGQITERGTHAELVAHGGFYADLFRRQELESELESGDEPAGRGIEPALVERGEHGEEVLA